MKAYWFEPADGVLGYNDGRKPEVGKTHTVKCDLALCNAGLHGSVKATDALQYAKSSRLWLVDITGKVQSGEDKVCGKRRKYLAVADVELILREHARWCALQVVHLWDVPQIVLDYLNTGDEDLRSAARAAAWAAARAASWDASRAAAWAASRAAWDAARASSKAAARDASRAASWDASRAAAWAASWDAAWDASWDAQNQRLEYVLTKIFIGGGS